jgi:tetratricopeptide (TPR) repeat protein
MSHHVILKLIGKIAGRAAREYIPSKEGRAAAHMYRVSPTSSNEPATGPKSWELFGSGNAELEKGNYVAAIQNYDAAIAIDSHRQYYFINRGIAKAENGDKEGALKDYEKAKQLDHIEFKRRAGKGLPGL